MEPIKITSPKTIRIMPKVIIFLFVA